MSTLFRIENPITEVGLWYNSEGKKTDFIKHGIKDAMNASLPMDYNEEYTKGGHWYSACPTIEMMRDWFSDSDLFQFKQAGYGLYIIDIPEYRMIDGHAIFLRDKAISIIEADMSLLEK